MIAVHVGRGDTPQVRAPKGGVKQGYPVLINDVFAIPSGDAKEGEIFGANIKGCWSFEKVNPDERIDPCKQVYWVFPESKKTKKNKKKDKSLEEKESIEETEGVGDSENNLEDDGQSIILDSLRIGVTHKKVKNSRPIGYSTDVSPIGSKYVKVLLNGLLQ